MSAELVTAEPQKVQPQPPRWFARYTGNRIPVADRMKIMDALALQVPVAQIERESGVCAEVIKAIEFSQAETIESRKSHLMAQAFRIAGKAYDRVEDTIDNAPLAQASVVAGIFSEKALLLAGEPTQIVQVNFNADDLHHELASLRAEIQSSSIVDTEFKQLPNP